MKHWAPVPINRVDDPDGLFQIEDGPIHITKGLTPIEHQRRMDGTPHTITGRMAVQPADTKLYLSDDKISKAGPECSPKTPEHDPDEIVKAYLNSDA
jgi:hypothetical protein